MLPQIEFLDIEKFLVELLGDEEVTVGMASEGDAAAYALVWEWGNTRQTKPGPKTVLGTNPDGRMVWLSSQAPFGYIRLNESQYWDAVKSEFRDLNLNQSSPEAMKKEITRCAMRAMQHIVEITSEAAPKDSGELSRSFVVVAPGDELLTQDTSSHETMDLEE